MNTEHTPGPWAVSKPSGNYIDAPAIKGSIAALTFSATHADARLIAAAPDLLAALQYVLDADAYDGALTMGSAALSPAIRDKIKRAIAKATGEETNA
jgi:hypothetical protein